ncbi:MAG: LnmK family bifunctional acyltransferase/decarboxylase, partial [Pikeienuella sp.]
MTAMKTVSSFVAGLPQLDVVTLSEDWALATALENHWRLLADSMGLRPSEWLDRQGDRMYGAVIQLSTSFDLTNVMREDDAFDAETTFLSIRKPHALSSTKFVVDGVAKAEVRLLTSFIKRQVAGSNKKFSKVRDIWTADDFAGELVDDLLDQHHAMKSEPDRGEDAMVYEANRIQDFNTADFMYFKNYVRIAKAAEWRAARAAVAAGEPTHLNETRDCFFYGNVDDGQNVTSKVFTDGETYQTSHHSDDGRRIFLTRGVRKPVEIAVR